MIDETTSYKDLCHFYQSAVDHEDPVALRRAAELFVGYGFTIGRLHLKTDGSIWEWPVYSEASSVRKTDLNQEVVQVTLHFYRKDTPISSFDHFKLIDSFEDLVNTVFWTETGILHDPDGLAVEDDWQKDFTLLQFEPLLYSGAHSSTYYKSEMYEQLAIYGAEAALDTEIPLIVQYAQSIRSPGSAEVVLYLVFDVQYFCIEDDCDVEYTLLGILDTDQALPVIALEKSPKKDENP